MFAFSCDAEQALHSGAPLWTLVKTVAEVIVGKRNLSLLFQVHGGGTPQAFSGRPLDLTDSECTVPASCLREGMSTFVPSVWSVNRQLCVY